MFVVAITALFACLTYHSVVWGGLPDVPSYAAHSLTLAGLYGAICLVDDQYDLLGAAWNENGIQRGAGALVIAFVVFLTVLFLTDTIADYSRGTFVTQFLLALPAQMAARGCLWRAVSRARKHGAGTGPGMVVLILPGVRNGSELLSLLPAYSEQILGSYEVRISDVELTQGSEVLEAQLTRIQDDCRRFRCDTVLVVCETDQLELINRTLFALWELPIRVRLLPIGLSDFLHRSQVAGYGRTRVLEMRSGPTSLLDRVLKRGLDLTVAGAAGLVLLPVVAAIAIAIKLDSAGPVLFRQKRHGFNNEPIQILKFRTMRTTEDGENEFRQAIRYDDRITRVGRILRRTNLDELPQLINVIRGDMSLVGPRPHAVAHNNVFFRQIQRMSRRHKVKPGITGWAQVHGLRGETDTLEKMQRRVEYDLYYIDNWSIYLDIKIMIMTIFMAKSYNNAY
jgi:Undecaprenyl-phosphate glucose phosphotransferase